MTTAFAAIIACAVLVSVGMWLSVRVARAGDLGLLPAYARRRMHWCRTNATHIQLGCALVIVGVACARFGGSFG